MHIMDYSLTKEIFGRQHKDTCGVVINFMTSHFRELLARHPLELPW